MTAAARRPVGDGSGAGSARVSLAPMAEDSSPHRLRRVLYLAPSSVIAHFVLGTLLRRTGKLDEARKAYRNARDLARLLPPDAVLELGEGERAGPVAELADAELAVLQGGASA